MLEIGSVVNVELMRVNEFLKFFFVLFLLYSRTFPVIAQAEVKTILKGTGDNYIRERANSKDSHHE